jgi:RNA-directed DNA polymerase
VRFPRATHLIITGHSKEVLEFEVKPLVEAFIAERGLVVSSEKTLITHLSVGFDFLGQNVRRYSNGKLLIKPARKSIAAFLTEIREIVRAHRGSTAHLLITKLNPVIRGWAMYHRHVVSKRTFTHVDRVLWRILWQWAKPRHPNKGLRWIKRKYFERVGTRNWIFHGNSATGGSPAHLRLFHAASVKIVRHILVRSGLNPYDPAWAAYIAHRAVHRSPPSVSTSWAFAEG